jgi:hypothetical protein
LRPEKFPATRATQRCELWLEYETVPIVTTVRVNIATTQTIALPLHPCLMSQTGSGRVTYLDMWVRGMLIMQPAGIIFLDHTPFFNLVFL